MQCDLDIQYEVLTTLAAHPELNIPYPLSLTDKPQFPPLADLYERLGGTTLLCHFYLMEEYGFIGRFQPHRRYCLTTDGRNFLTRVEDKGGWNIVKTEAINRPVRLTMKEISRWSRSWS